MLPMTEEKRAARFWPQNKAMADKALRVLAGGHAPVGWRGCPRTTARSIWSRICTFVGLAGMIDPVRPEVKAAIASSAGTAGIRPVMITGDHRDTAVAIAKELGISGRSRRRPSPARSWTASATRSWPKRWAKYSVYARVQPEHKVRIVNAWRKRGGCDGHDRRRRQRRARPSRAADIGVGMGITGTDVTKNVADMVLADDNFATIVGAVGEGRRIYDNIRKAIQFLLASNMSEVLGVFCATLLGFTLLKPVHLLWINLITDCFPALALGLEKAEPDVMQPPAPQRLRDGIFAGGLGVDIAYQGLLITR